MLLSGDRVSLPEGLDHEWLMTNGLGGYAMGTAAGVNTRGYHGWLVAAENPPRRRRLRLAKVDIDLKVGSAPAVALSSNLYDDTVYPDGVRRLLSFASDPRPVWRYRVGNGIAEVSLFMVPRKNAVVMELSWEGSEPAEVWLRPLVNDRDHHRRTTRGDFGLDVRNVAGGWRLTGGEGLPLWIQTDDGVDREPDPEPVWIERMRYPVEERRGYTPHDDHVSPGRLHLRLAAGERVRMRAEVAAKEPSALAAAAPGAPLALDWVDASPMEQSLAHAATAFTVETADGEPAVIAGYPWFDEWARDTFIALPGLYLVQGRLAAAADLLRRWTGILRRDLLMTGMDEQGHSVGLAADSPLWFCLAVYRLWAYGGDITGLTPMVEHILQAFHAGAGPGGVIGIDGTGLVRADLPGHALTWMDAAWPEVVTPRTGYPVELTALYYKALAEAARMGLGGAPYAEWANASRAAFRLRFLRPGGLLYDRVRPNGEPDASVRPNQLWAAGLPFPLLSPEESADLLEAIEPHLWTARGLRTLGPDDPEYLGRYEGTQEQRDRAYHQGTVWPWLMGAWADAHHYAYPNGSGPIFLQDCIESLSPMVSEGVAGHVSEVYDGDPPQRPGGALAQAWSVAEILRVSREWVAGRAPAVLADPTKPPGLAERR